MAYILGQRKNSPDTIVASSTTPAQTPGVTPQSASTPAPASSSGPTPGQGGYVNFQNYLGLDSGAGQQMAGRVAQGVQQVGQQAQNQIRGDSTAFNNKVAGGEVNYNAINPAPPPTGLPAAFAGMPYSTSSPYDPTQFNSGIGTGQNTTQKYQNATQQAGNYQKAADANATAAKQTYSGPLDANGAFDASTQVAGNAQARAQQLQTPGGVADAIKSTYGGGFTQGGSALDAALAGAAGGQQLSATANQYGDLMNQLGLAESNASQSITNAQDASAANAAKYGQMADMYGWYAKNASQVAHSLDPGAPKMPIGGPPGEPNTPLPNIPNLSPPGHLGLPAGYFNKRGP